MSVNRVLIADDSSTTRRLLEKKLEAWDFGVTSVRDGEEAWQLLQKDDSPRLLLLDWIMPVYEGTELCRMLREKEAGSTMPTYIILLTANREKGDIVRGLEAGANDYITKPFDDAELKARLDVGLRVLSLQKQLQAKIRDLQRSLEEIKTLQGILPICPYCKKVRNDDNYWEQVEEYITHRSAAEFSHAICPSCFEKHLAPQLKDLGIRRK